MKSSHCESRPISLPARSGRCVAAMIDSAQIDLPIFTLDRQGRILSSNAALHQQLVPLGVKELAPLTPLLDLPIAAESKPTLREELEKALAGVPASASHACLAPDPTAIPPMSIP